MFVIWKRAARIFKKFIQAWNYMSKQWTFLSEKYLFYLIGARALVAGQAWIVERMWRNVLPLPAWTVHIVWSLTSQGSFPAPARPSLPASSVNRPTTPATCSITPACTTLPAVPSQMEPPSVFAQSVRYTVASQLYPTYWPTHMLGEICHSQGFMFTACLNSLAFRWVGYSGNIMHFLLITSLLDAYFSPQ